MKKKYTVSSKEKKDWIDFTKQIGNINPKEVSVFDRLGRQIIALSGQRGGVLPVFENDFRNQRLRPTWAQLWHLQL